MTKRIQLLSSQLANQIAAGEVVERPAAVLKELLENSLDADSTRIDIDIEKGGIQLIRVRDDGMGIHPDDLTLALNRHATSKIYTLNDLEKISSLGFRGEALASISSVSKLTLTSCLRGAKDAWQIQSNTETVTPAAHTEGTTIEVYDLFFNTPARRRFLRTEQTEFGHLEDVFKRIVLSHYDVGFTLRHDQKIIKQFRPALTDIARTQRAAAIFGNTFMDNAVAINNQSSTGMRVSGWIALPSFSRNHTDLQYCYINNRVVRDKLINHAVRLAYQDALPPGRYPAFILYLEIDPAVVDVNVHPTKHEVRFHESRQIHDFLFATIRDALAQTSTEPQFFVREPRADYDPRPTHTAPTYITEKKTSIKHLISDKIDGQIIIDMAAARKQCIIEHLKNTVPSQPLLIPQSISIPTHTEHNLTLLQTLGIDITQAGPDKLIIRQMPPLLKNAQLSVLIPALLTLTHTDDAIDCIANHLAGTISASLSIELHLLE